MKRGWTRLSPVQTEGVGEESMADHLSFLQIKQLDPPSHTLQEPERDTSRTRRI